MANTAHTRARYAGRITGGHARLARFSPSARRPPRSRCGRPATPRAMPSTHSLRRRPGRTPRSCRRPLLGAARALFSSRGWGQLTYSEAHPGVGSLEAFELGRGTPDDASGAAVLPLHHRRARQPARPDRRRGGGRLEVECRSAAITAAASCSAARTPCTRCTSASRRRRAGRCAGADRLSGSHPRHRLTASAASASPSAIRPPPSRSR
jgi:hypothetical protein